MVCPYCVAAKNFLKSKGQEWTEVRVDTDSRRLIADVGVEELTGTHDRVRLRTPDAAALAGRLQLRASLADSWALRVAGTRRDSEIVVATGEGETPAPPSTRYSPELVAAVKRLQDDYGMKADGVVGKDTLEVLNTSAADRARTVAVAINSTNGADALVSPGHIFPLAAQPGGVHFAHPA